MIVFLSKVLTILCDGFVDVDEEFMRREKINWSTKDHEPSLNLAPMVQQLDSSSKIKQTQVNYTSVSR